MRPEDTCTVCQQVGQEIRNALKHVALFPKIGEDNKHSIAIDAKVEDILVHTHELHDPDETSMIPACPICKTFVGDLYTVVADNVADWAIRDHIRQIADRIHAREGHRD